MNQAILKAKTVVVDEVLALAKDKPALIVVEYRGMSVSELAALRRVLRDMNAKIGIYKNSMVARAAETLKYQGFEAHLTGPNAFVFCPDAIEGAKALLKFARRNGKMQVKAAVVEGRVLDAAGVKTLATLPGKLGLISMFLQCLQAPVRTFAATLQAATEKNQ